MTSKHPFEVLPDETPPLSEQIDRERRIQRADFRRLANKVDGLRGLYESQALALYESQVARRGYYRMAWVATVASAAAIAFSLYAIATM